MEKSEQKGVFHFKQFRVSHRRSTLKVGTDAVLLGIWAQARDASKILDIGTGNGVIALLMSQRFEDSKIVAIDIDKESIEEARCNFDNSPWHSRIVAIHQDVLLYARQTQEHYDLIVCNPPFFEASLLSQNTKLNQAKHTLTLDYSSLFLSVNQLIAENGVFALICPYDKADKVFQLAKQYQFHCRRKLVIYPKKSKSANRIIIEFDKTTSRCQSEQLIVYQEDNTYTSQYRRWGRDYYINF